MRLPEARLLEIEAQCTEAMNEPTGKRPPYGDTSGRLDLEMALVVLANLEHENASQEHQDELFVTARMACQEVQILRSAMTSVSELLAEVRRLQDVRRSLTWVAIERGRRNLEQADRIMESAARFEAAMVEIEKMRPVVTAAESEYDEVHAFDDEGRPAPCECGVCCAVRVYRGEAINADTDQCRCADVPARHLDDDGHLPGCAYRSDAAGPGCTCTGPFDPACPQCKAEVPAC